VITKPWPGILRTLYKDPERYEETYFSRYGKEIYFVGDGARRDAEGYYTITGRVDDVMNVSGHRLSTAEIESALVGHKAVAEAAVIGKQDEDKGQVPVAYVIWKATGRSPTTDEGAEAARRGADRSHRPPPGGHRGGRAPKTRSGKIMRRVLRGIAEGEDDLGDTSTLADPSVVDTLQEQAAAQR
jgi:acetyl-CoA synthetase